MATSFGDAKIPCRTGGGSVVWSLRNNTGVQQTLDVCDGHSKAVRDFVGVESGGAGARASNEGVVSRPLRRGQTREELIEICERNGLTME